LQLDCLSIHLDFLGAVLNSDGDCVGLTELVIAEAIQDGRFAHVVVSYHYDLVKAVLFHPIF
jgi:hypothetical protein